MRIIKRKAFIYIEIVDDESIKEILFAVRLAISTCKINTFQRMQCKLVKSLKMTETFRND